MTKAMQSEVLTSPHEKLFETYGHLIWWTVRQGIYDPKPLQDAAKQHSLPDAIAELLVGAKGKSAWDRATNIRTTAIVVSTDPATRQQVTYTTRDADSTERLLVREIVDAQNHKHSALQVGILTFDNGFKFTDEPPYWPHHAEVDQVVATLEQRYYERLDRTDDVKLRTALLCWLKTHYRVPVRGNGGIYFVPQCHDAAKNTKLIREIFAIRDWLASAELGTLTAIELSATPTTTVDDIIQSAVEEIMTEIQEVEGKLNQYKSNTKMNAGSRAEAAKSQVARMTELVAKIEALEGSLGDKVGLTRANADIVLNRASTMHRMSNAQVSEYRVAKGRA